MEQRHLCIYFIRKLKYQKVNLLFQRLACLSPNRAHVSICMYRPYSSDPVYPAQKPQSFTIYTARKNHTLVGMHGVELLIIYTIFNKLFFCVQPRSRAEYSFLAEPAQYEPLHPLRAPTSPRVMKI